MGTGLERSTVIDAGENVMRSAPERCEPPATEHCQEVRTRG
jgi:hypothetical protein